MVPLRNVSKTYAPTTITSVSRFHRWKTNPLGDVKNGKRGFRVLCLDGGGIRNLVICEVLKEIEKRSGKMIGHSFDMICGTSSGGLLAFGSVLVSLTDRSLDDYSKLFVKCATEMFSAPPMKQVAGILSKRARYAFTEQSIEHFGRIFTGDLRLNEMPEFPMVFSLARIHLGNLFLFQNYKNEASLYYGTSSVPIWQAFRASAAAPYYFTPVNIDKNFIYDAGITHNNPSEVALHELQALWKGWGNEGHPPIDVFVSIGTGYRSKIINLVRKDPHEIHCKMLELSQQLNLTYFRIDPVGVAFQCGLGETGKIPHLVESAKLAMEKKEHSVMIDRIVDIINKE